MEESENKKDSNKKGFWVKFSAIAVIFFLFGFYFGKGAENYADKVTDVEGKETPENITADFNQFWKAWSLLDEKYVPPQIEESSVSDQERVWGAIKGMVRSLGDPNTIFLVPSELESFEREISGNFEGVGMEVDIRDDLLTVVAPLKGTPAYKAGIKAGDVIFKIDDKETNNLSIDQAVNLIRGEKGTPVTLTIFREGESEPVVVTIIRDVIDIPTIETEWRNDVYIVKLYNFSAVSPILFRNALREFVVSDSNKLILDLRGNPGGFLEASVDISSWFLPAGEVIVREDFGEGKEDDDVVYRSKGYNVFGSDLEMVVLIDGGSASASEIVAGALKEHGIATLVGRQSFGKGSVQELVRVTPDTSLKVTVARWVTPEGKSISLEGLTPDVIVEPQEYGEDNEGDLILEKALELLR